MAQYVYAVKASLVLAGMIIINFHRVIMGIVAGMIGCIFLVALLFSGGLWIQWF
jgi:hypothetical protein